MIDGLLEGCLETIGPWIFGAVFLVAALWVLLSTPGAESPAVSGILGLLLLHTSALLIVGLGFKKATRVLAISWVVFVVVFLVVGAILNA